METKVKSHLKAELTIKLISPSVKKLEEHIAWLRGIYKNLAVSPIILNVGTPKGFHCFISILSEDGEVSIK